LFHDIKSGMIEDGTAIGNGLATSVSRLKDSKAISKVIILLTDGVNNKSKITVTDPVQSDVECFEGKKVIHVNGEIYHIGKMDSWGDIESIDCKAKE